jgi:hypothetical protein
MDRQDAWCHDDRVSTGGSTGPDQGLPGHGQGAPSVTTLLPPLARLRLAMARVPARQVLGAALVTLWAAWLIALWVTQPRLVPPDRLDDDLAAGRVSEYAVVVLREDRTGRFGNSPAVVGWLASGDGREQLSAEDRDDWSPEGDAVTIAYWVDSRVADLRVVDPATASPQSLSAVADQLDEAGVEYRTADITVPVPGKGVGTALALLMLAAFMVVIAGPRPGCGTRWFWFWLLSLPLGLGVLALAVLEFLRPPRLVVVPESPADGDATASEDVATPKRLSGWAGFWIGIFGAILITVVVDQLADLAPLILVRA